MWKINFYLLPSKDYSVISSDEVLDFGSRIEEIKKKDEVYVPFQFYEMVDENGINIFECTSGNQDEIRYLMELVTKQKISEESYERIREKEIKGYLVISERDISLDNEHLCVYNTNEYYEQGLVRINDIIKVKRYYLSKTTTYDEYLSRLAECFPQLIFHDNAFLSIKKLGTFSRVKTELSKHLCALNDYGKRIYFECSRNEEKSLNYLRSKCGIECSGKGSNETKKYKSKMFFKGKEYLISCNSHTKFYNGNNDQRIYFSWGKSEIDDFKIIIIWIGSHWSKANTLN